jgi:hypothetical protein
MLKSVFTFSDKVPECYIQMTVIHVAKIGDDAKYARQYDG